MYFIKLYTIQLLFKYTFTTIGLDLGWAFPNHR
jgi:hypothetical protein